MQALLFGLLFAGQGASKLDQLTLALTWNRSDIAAEKILTDDITWEPGMTLPGNQVSESQP